MFRLIFFVSIIGVRLLHILKGQRINHERPWVTVCRIILGDASGIILGHIDSSIASAIFAPQGRPAKKGKQISSTYANKFCRFLPSEVVQQRPYTCIF